MASRLLQLTAPKMEMPETQIPITTPAMARSRLGMLLKEPIIPEIPKAVELFPSTMEMLAELQIDPLSLKENPKETMGAAWDTLKTTVKQSFSTLKDFFQISTKEPVSKEVGEKLKEVAAVGHLIFSPISALFEGANKIPVLGSVSKLISLPFIVAGEGGAKIGQEIVENLPISNEAKENIKQGVEEIFALGSQLAIGKIMHITEKKTTELVKRFGEKDAQTIINKANEFAKQANEPVPEVIKAEVKPAEVKPTKKYLEVPREQLPVKMAEAEKGVSSLEARMKGIFETENVKAAKREAEARGLDISIYDKMSKPEQLRMAVDYAKKTPQYKILEVLEGKREAPRGLLHNAIMLALEEKSLRDRNVDLAIKLASLRSTRMGQEISILTEVATVSPVSGLQEIIRARRGRTEAELKQGETIQTKKTSTVKEISTEAKKFQLKLSEVENLLKDIIC